MDVAVRALTAPPSDPTSVLLQYGVVGAVALALAWFAWRAYRRESDRADRLEQQLQATNERITERFAEVLGVVKDTLSETNSVLRDLTRRQL